MKENNAHNMETKVDKDYLKDYLISVDNDSEETLAAKESVEEDKLDDLLAAEPIVEDPKKGSGVGKKLAVAAGIGVVGAAAAGVGAYAVANDGINIVGGDDDNSRDAGDSARYDDDRVNLRDFLFGDRDQVDVLVNDPADESNEDDVVYPADEVVVEPVVGNDTELFDEELLSEDGSDLVVDPDDDLFSNIEEPVEESAEELIKEPEINVVGQNVDVNVMVTPVNNSDSLVSLASINTDGMSFNEAFAAARAEVGANGVFKWNGGVYGTFYENEWAGMSDEFKSEFSNHNWAAEYQDGNMEVALGDQDIIMTDGGTFDINDDGLINNVDVELIADNTQNFGMSFILDGDVSMTEILDEVNEYLPGEILAGDFNVDVEVVGMEPIYEAYEVPVESDFIAADVDDDMMDNDLLDDVMIDNDDFIC